MDGSRLERTVVQRATQHAKSGRVSIAYQVVGDGPTDLTLVPGFVSHVEVAWEEPRLAHFLGRLASFSRLIVFDKRGTGKRVLDPVVHAEFVVQDVGTALGAQAGGAALQDTVTGAGFTTFAPRSRDTVQHRAASNSVVMLGPDGSCAASYRVRLARPGRHQSC